MLFAQNNTIDKYRLYISFFDEISKGNLQSKYKDILEKIVTVTHKLSIKESDYSNIPNEIFDIVSILNLNHQAYFEKISVENIGSDVYKQIAELLKKDVEEMNF